MHITKPNTDQSATFTLYADGIPCPEYVLPDHSPDPNAAEVFVAVPSGATLTLSGTISGSLLRCRIDLLADGSFVNNRVIEAGPGGGRQGLLQNRKVEFKSFYNVPQPHQHERNRKAKVVEGDLVVNYLSQSTPHRLLEGHGADLGVGSLALVFSLCQVEGEKYGKDGESSYPNHTLGSWKTSLEEVRGSGIKPEFCLDMEIYKDANPISDKKANLFWRDYTSARLGNAPWGTIVFYYRSILALERAGCVAFKESMAVAPFVGRFVRAEATAKKTSSRGNGAESLFVTPEPVEERVSVKGKRRKLGVGQRLALAQGEGASPGSGGHGSPAATAAAAVLPPGHPQPTLNPNPLASSAPAPRAAAPNVLSGALFDALAKISAQHTATSPAAPNNTLPSNLGKRPPHTSPSTPNPQTAPVAPMLPPTTPGTPIPVFSPLSAASPSLARSPAPGATPTPTPKKSHLQALRERKAALEAGIAADRARKATLLAQAEAARQAREAARLAREALEREKLEREEAERVLLEREEAERLVAEQRRLEEERQREEAQRERAEEEAMERELEDLRKQAQTVREEREVAEREMEGEVQEAEREGVQEIGGGVAAGGAAEQGAEFFDSGAAAADAPADGLAAVGGAMPFAGDLELNFDELFGPDAGDVDFRFTEVELAAAAQFQMTDERMAELGREWDGVVDGLGDGNGDGGAKE